MIWPNWTWENDPKTAALVSSSYASGNWWRLHQIYQHLIVSDTFTSDLEAATYLMTEKQIKWVQYWLIGLKSDGSGWIDDRSTQFMLCENVPGTDEYWDPEFPGWASSTQLKGFECWLVYTGSGTQPVVYAGYRQAPAKKGKIKLAKTSANTAVTNGNPCYSLAGAVYGVYSDQGCTKGVTTLTTDANGTATSGELDAGTYWLKETSAPMCFLKDSTVKSVTVAVGGTASVTFADQPAMDPIVAIAKKLDAETGKASPQGTGTTLAGAEFTVSFYAGWYYAPSEHREPSKLPSKPTRQWVFKTGSNGAAVPDKAHLVGNNNSAFYTNKDGTFSLPSGTVTVQETKAPKGYAVADAYKSPVLQRVAVGEGLSAVRSYNVPVVKEPVQRGGLSIQKCDADTGKASPQGWASFKGAEFTVYNRNAGPVVAKNESGQLVSYAKDAEVCTLKLDSKGYVETAKDALPLGTYGVKETKAPEKGYLATPGEHLVTISTPNALTPVTHK